MNTYRLTVTVEVEVDCFDESDACDSVIDAFGPGEYGGYSVKEFEVTSIKEV